MLAGTVQALHFLYMERKLELLAPGGDIDSIKSAILAGADAVYCGLNKFNARNRAANIGFEDLLGIIRLAHKNDCQVFLTLNIILLDSEIPELTGLLNKLVNTNIDGIILQDLGLFYMVSNYFPSLKIHASTQLTTHNEGQIKFLSALSANRVNLSRELNIQEIKDLTLIAARNNVLTEVFVHGSYCISFSGICYMSSLHGGKSGNRGRCSQPCRDRYVSTPVGKDFPLNMKDNSAFFDLRELYDAGVASLKIEGRIKEFEYVYTVVKSWKEQIKSFFTEVDLKNDNSDLHKVFNRDFTNAFLKGNITKDMFIENPMSNSTKHLSVVHNFESKEAISKGQLKFYEEKEDLRAEIKAKIDELSVAKLALAIHVSGDLDSPLHVKIVKSNSSFEVKSKSNLAGKGTEALTKKMLLRRLKAIDETEYYIEKLEVRLHGDLYLPFKELTAIKKDILYILNGSKAIIDPIKLPALKKQNKIENNPSLVVLLSSKEDLKLINGSSAEVYFQLPNSFKYRLKELIDLFDANKSLIPWFPSVIIGEDYKAAIEFLIQVKPKNIVTNNSGIAFEAFKNGISWVAGPFMNIINSYSLLTLKEKFNCSGSYLSNEINKFQLKGIKKPDDFKLYYSIYHPIELMTQRLCMFHQVTGCEKNIVDDTCLQNCEKHSTITNLKEDTFFIEKSKGNYHRIYNEANFLNTEIITDIPDTFSAFLIDLRDIKTKTKLHVDKAAVIKLFEDYLDGNPGSKEALKKNIQFTTNSQYKKGI